MADTSAASDHGTETRGDFTEALEAAYTRLFTRLVAAAAGIAGDSEAGREAVQNAFMQMLASPGPRDLGSIEPWVWRAVVNAAREVRRRSWLADRLRGSGSGEAERLAPAMSMGHPEVRAAVARLPVKQRTALFLRHYADMDYAAIAAVMGVSEGTVGSTLNAAHRALRSALEECS